MQLNRQDAENAKFNTECFIEKEEFGLLLCACGKPFKEGLAGCTAQCQIDANMTSCITNNGGTQQE